jgi:hypothetical protein
MTAVEDNVVDSILKCIRLVEQKQAALAAKDKSTEAAIEDARELLFDVHIALCRLASALVTAPITGRIFLPLPSSYVTPEEAQVSLRSQLGLKPDAVA